MASFCKIFAMLFLVTGAWAYLAAPFIAGMVWCEGCNGFLGNTIGRLFIGFVFCVASAMSGGFPGEPMGADGRPLSMWPYIFECWVVLFTVFGAWSGLAALAKPDN